MCWKVSRLSWNFSYLYGIVRVVVLYCKMVNGLNPGVSVIGLSRSSNNSLSKGYPHPEDHDKPISIVLYCARCTLRSIVLCCAVQWFVSCRVVLYRAVSCCVSRVVLYRAVPCRVSLDVSCCIVPCRVSRVVSCCIVLRKSCRAVPPKSCRAVPCHAYTVLFHITDGVEPLTLSKYCVSPGVLFCPHESRVLFLRRLILTPTSAKLLRE